MSWKQFLRPNMKKIIITIAIALISYTLMINSECQQATCVGCPEVCPPIHSITVYVTSITALPWYATSIAYSYSIETIEKDFLGVFYEAVNNSRFYYYGRISEYLIGIFLETIYLYLISCIIVWTFDKVKKK